VSEPNESAAPSVAVVGGGPWGVALATAAARAGSEVVLVTRRAPSVGARIRVTTELAEVAHVPLVIVAVPSLALRDAARNLGDHLTGAHLVVHGVRGLEHEHLWPLSEVIREETSVRRIGALGGPVQAGELSKGQPSAIVCGSKFPEVTDAVRTALRSRWLRVYTTTDLRGLEWSSALVGCLSVGVGFAQEAGAGPGLLAALIARGVDEAARLVLAAGAEERTMLGIGGYGDLLASIALADRPEVALGKALAQGKEVEEAITIAHLRVEAIDLIPRIVAFAKERKVAAPVFGALFGILQKKPVAMMVEQMFAG
jgi:glycerol-3-phosphate dehydrogenase (NAD(P)+)